MPHDTSLAARSAQFAAYRRMSAARTADIAAEMSEAIRNVALERIRRQNPQLTLREARLLLIRELHGLEPDR